MSDFGEFKIDFIVEHMGSSTPGTVKDTYTWRIKPR